MYFGLHEFHAAKRYLTILPHDGNTAHVYDGVVAAPIRVVPCPVYTICSNYVWTVFAWALESGCA